VREIRLYDTNSREVRPLAPHRDAIHTALAAVLECPVNVKATTGEGMGFVGRGEGAAALAIATLD
jgi:2C-methyl-D-erythritol 2,4-cyclodiphosphate synthase